MIDLIKKCLDSVILAGIIVLIIGLYYMIVKAGIPYQDPPLELQIKYAVNMQIGDTLTVAGFLIAVIGAIIRVILGILCKRKDK